MKKLMYPDNGKETVIPLSLIGSDTKLTLFTRYIGVGGQAFESAKYRLSLLKGHHHPDMVSIHKDGAVDSRDDVTRVNPHYLVEADAPKQIAIPSDIQALITSVNESLAKETLTDDEAKTLKKDEATLDYYFSTTRNYSL